MDEGFESDEEYERRRYGRSSKYREKSLISSIRLRQNDFICQSSVKDLIIDDTNHPRTIIKTITFEEPSENDFGDRITLEKISSQQNPIPQFKQLEPLKMVKREISKDFVPSSSSTSSADTIINTRIGS